MGKKERILVMLSFIFILLLLPSSQVGAAQPYMAGYLRGSVVTAERVILMIHPYSTDFTQIPSGKWLGGVTSVAGASGSTPSGYIYQNLLAYQSHADGDKSMWAPQTWLGSTQKYYHAEQAGYNSYFCYYVRTDISSGTVTYRLYAYRTLQYWDNDWPIIRTWSHTITDTNFLVGRQSHNSKWFMHFQFGVESNTAITETQWEMMNQSPFYYNGGNWRILPGYSIRGSSSYITWKGTSNYLIGGTTYSGVTKKVTGSNYVCWKRTGSTIGNNVRLWSTSGIQSGYPPTPYN